jgi:hypothetical protein
MSFSISISISISIFGIFCVDETLTSQKFIRKQHDTSGTAPPTFKIYEPPTQDDKPQGAAARGTAQDAQIN